MILGQGYSVSGTDADGGQNRPGLVSKPATSIGDVGIASQMHQANDGAA
jgi:hypothetical protein